MERAFAERREVGVGLDQRGVRIDLGRDLAAAALGHFGGEHPAQPVAEITLVDGAAGKLVRDLQRGRGLRRARPQTQDGRRGKRRYEDVAACKHETLPWTHVDWNGSTDLAGILARVRRMISSLIVRSRAPGKRRPCCAATLL